MKKLLFTAIAVLGLGATQANAQVNSEGTVLFDLYYGAPNLYKTVLKSAAVEDDTDGVNIGGTGPVGFRGEYLVADKIGVGIDVCYSSASVSWQDDSLVYEPVSATYLPRTYDYKVGTQKIGVMATINYHFVSHEKVDAYVMFGAGYKNRSFNFESDDPNYEGVTGSATLIPVAARIGVGMRYFFIPNVGLNLNLGFGQGSIINGGVSIKI